MDWRQRISFDPLVCHGKACIAGTRVLVSVVLDSVADGVAVSELLRAYPLLTEEDIRAALAYAAERLRSERYVPLPMAAA